MCKQETEKDLAVINVANLIGSDIPSGLTEE